MAVDLGDHSSGFYHSEVIRFINNEILMNGGGPEFYMAFRLRPWNEIEDQLCAILIDPQVPRSLKRACTWSALALSVRLAARQCEQQAYMVGLPQEANGRYPSAPRVSVSEPWQPRQQREEAVTQLSSTPAVLQQATRECDLFRGRLHHAEGVVHMVPMVQDRVPGTQAQQLESSVVPMNPDHARVMDAVSGYDDRWVLEAQMPAATNKVYMPGSTSPWPLAMQPSVPDPGPDQFPPHLPFPMGSPFLMPFSPPIVRETEARVVVPVTMPPMHPPGPFAAPCFQDPAGLWDQRNHMAAEGLPVIQHSVLPLDIRDFSLEGDSEKPKATNILGAIGNHIHRQGPQRTQEKAVLADFGNDNEDEGEEKEAKATSAAAAAAVEEAEIAAAEIANEAAAEVIEDVEEEEENHEEDEEEEEAYDVSTALQCLQKLYFSDENELHSRSGMSPQASAPAPLGSSRSQVKEEGEEKGQLTFMWESWSQAVRDSPKKQQPQLPRKGMKPQVQAASASQPVLHAPMNWICPKCKAMNFSWRKICYKCKTASILAECGGQTY